MPKPDPTKPWAVRFLDLHENTTTDIEITDDEKRQLDALAGCTLKSGDEIDVAPQLNDLLEDRYERPELEENIKQRRHIIIPTY